MGFYSLVLAATSHRQAHLLPARTSNSSMCPSPRMQNGQRSLECACRLAQRRPFGPTPNCSLWPEPAGPRSKLIEEATLVEQSGENQAVLAFMTHLNQIGQTGATSRHPKGLSTCCPGEEPHVVGWRFIHERRAINLDPNCGWARGKADVLNVALAFQVMTKLNELLSEKESAKEVATPAST